MRSPRTLAARLALWYGSVLIAVLVAFSASVYLAAIAEDEEEAAEADTPLERAELAAQARVIVVVSVGLPIALLVSVIGGLLLTKRSFGPLDEIVRLTARIGVDDLKMRVPESTDPGLEIEALVASLNRMLTRLETAVDGIRRFTADASHELRTPLTSMMGDLELALRRPRSVEELEATMESTLESLGGMARLVDSLLTLARSDAQQLALVPQSLHLATFLERTLEPYRLLAAERSIALVVECGNDLSIEADPLWLGRALCNLVDNGLKFTGAEGSVRVVARSVGDGVVIEVRDTGPGFTETDRAHAFERFYRSDATRGASEGTGLGLPLALEIARAMGGELTIDMVDRGASLSLRIPRSRA